ncbi:hypothetical protein [Vibrio panuliri]|uniref:Uncharacterized protein n=1 Tax=Vibrio panuliri TaxID=1381081 RepID=A0A1Q9HQ26_9VIBR|nr:hypothetical protein [Vibrio panuliri]KAB1457847.1 hypothetical protein F7O85_08955 [Vibrio panuliri]OLQ92971.1 hypothetical protein BIY22_00290 [Vibrio panuliri]OLQ96269.1 hypothetical protein BIY20_19540 [Vibrio panuliri]
MIGDDDFKICDRKLRYKKDEYPLASIKSARVKTNALQDHILRITCIGLVVSSVVLMICPESLGLFTAPFAFSLGILSALASVRKYELQIEFQHSDETGLQWVSVAKSNQPKVKHLFEHQAVSILARI